MWKGEKGGGILREGREEGKKEEGLRERRRILRGGRYGEKGEVDMEKREGEGVILREGRGR